MRKGNSVVIFTVLIGILLVITTLYNWYAPVEWRYHQKFTEANNMIKAIEEFKIKEGRYPFNSSEVGIAEVMSGPNYTLTDTGIYIVSFPGGNCFFCMQAYNSSTRAWSEHD
ncbi:hypothetical protein [Sulfurovum sp.]|uniref:hypothetical protein n=1 Tax=Sulfurovum sp. TaxID=1969726 RepID=UPI0035686052